jgi:hypothetical protein
MLYFNALGRHRKEKDHAWQSKKSTSLNKTRAELALGDSLSRAPDGSGMPAGAEVLVVRRLAVGAVKNDVRGLAVSNILARLKAVFDFIEQD